MNKLIFLDIDGTLLRDNGTFNEKIKKIIEKHQKKDNKIILTSARPRYKVLEICEKLNLNTYFISSILISTILHSSYSLIIGFPNSIALFFFVETKLSFSSEPITK